MSLVAIFNTVFAQDRKDSSSIADLVEREILQNYSLSNERLSNLILSEKNVTNYSLIEIIKFPNNSKYKELVLFKTKIQYKYQSIYVIRKNKKIEDTLEFYIIKHLNGDYYKLFGFTCSDIKSLEIEDHILFDFMFKNDVLSKKNAKKFVRLYNSHNTTLVPNSFNYPAQIMGIFYPEKKISSVMLPARFFYGLRM